MLNGDLRLANAETMIESGATFAGGGTLVNLATHNLRLLDGADVDVLGIFCRSCVGWYWRHGGQTAAWFRSNVATTVEVNTAFRLVPCG